MRGEKKRDAGKSYITSTLDLRWGHGFKHSLELMKRLWKNIRKSICDKRRHRAAPTSFLFLLLTHRKSSESDLLHSNSIFQGEVREKS